MESHHHNRRQFLSKTAAAGLGLTLVTPSTLVLGAEEEKGESPLEDLMSEHGALNRVLLIFEECQRRLREDRDLSKNTLEEAAVIIKTFIQDHHEKLEEDFVFPNLEKRGKILDLVKTLRNQHEAGRIVIKRVIKLSQGPLDNDARVKVDRGLSAFIRMYRPHESFENTIVFPTFRDVVTRKEYERLGMVFEEREHRLFGEDAFHSIINRITKLEKKLGIHDLNQFTPAV